MVNFRRKVGLGFSLSATSYKLCADLAKLLFLHSLQFAKSEELLAPSFRLSDDFDFTETRLISTANLYTTTYSHKRQVFKPVVFF